MNAMLRILAWLLAVALVALPVVAVLNGWVGAERWPLSRLRVTGEFERVQAEQLKPVLRDSWQRLSLGVQSLRQGLGQLLTLVTARS